MSFDLKAIYAHMGLFALIVAWTLVALAVTALAVFFERMFVFFRSQLASARFARKTRVLFEEQSLEAVVRAAREARHSHVAALVGHGLAHYLTKVQQSGSAAQATVLASNELQRSYDRIASDVRRGLSVLATVGSIAPFVGLLGTVVGIIEAFGSIAKEGSGGLSAVSGGISEALVVTALGLLVAIPAVFFYNICASRADAVLQRVELSASELGDYLSQLDGRVPPTTGNVEEVRVVERSVFAVKGGSHATAS